MQHTTSFKIFNVLVLLCLHYLLFAQKEYNIWYFGEFAGMDFNGASPAALTNGALNTTEGCASICDSAGNLLFYTDGVSIWNRNHTIMPNGTGLTGHISSTQSAIIIKKPGSGVLYYVFTVDCQAGYNGLRYSEVDMSLQSGLGDVNSNKNIPIVYPTCEKIAAVRHKNNNDYWIITHLFGSDTFHSYLLTSAGLNMVPVVSNVGSVISGDYLYTLGYMKASINGKRIAMGNNRMFSAELFDFDNSSGLVSNPINFLYPLNENPYGVEFSPNGNFLYVGVIYFPQSKIYQYNLLAGSPSAIDSSRVVIGTINASFGALQLASDRKIYCAQAFNNYLGVINHPDSPGLTCNYNSNGVHLGGKISWLGLPTFLNSIINIGFNYQDVCFGDSTVFNISLISFDSVFWDFGDVNSGIHNTSKELTPKHCFTHPGNFVVKLIYFYWGLSDTIINTISIKPLPDIKLGNDTVLCQGEEITLDATTPNATYLWHDSSTDSIFTVTIPGTYWVEVTVNSCIARDTINITGLSPPVINLGNDTVLCQGISLTLDVSTLNAAYLWQNNSIKPKFIVTQAGLYCVEVSNSCGTDTDSIYIEYEDCSPIFEMPNVFTPNGDGFNDYFVPKRQEKISRATIIIYNRWGKILFESNQITEGWNRKFNGKNCTEGTYFWIARYYDFEGKEYKMQGSVSLLR